MIQTTNWRRNIHVFVISTFFQWFYVAIGVWVLIWRQYLSWPEIALVTAIGLIVSLVLELPSGAMADMIGRKATVLFGRFLGVMGFVVFSFAQTLPMFILANVLYLANWAFESGALSALLYDSLKENNQVKDYYQKTETDAFFYATLGMALASIIGGYLYTIDIHLPYLVSIVAAVIALITAFWLEEPKLDSVKFNFKNYIKQNWEGLLHIFRLPLIRSISIFSVLIDFISYVGLWYLYEPRLSEAGFPASWMGWLVAGTYVIRAVGTKLIPFVMKVGDRHIPIVLTLMQIVGSFLSFIETKTGAVVSVYARKFADGFRKPILNRLQNDQIESRYRSTSLSAISLLSNLLIASVAPLIGWGIEHYSVAMVMGISGILGLVMVLPAALSVSRITKNYSV